MRPDGAIRAGPRAGGARAERVVAAPPKFHRPAGDRLNTDARDAAHQARLLHVGEITPVRIPDPRSMRVAIWLACVRMPAPT